jgi:hypothetical protein
MYFSKPIKNFIGRLLFVVHLEGQIGYGALGKPSAVFSLQFRKCWEPTLQVPETHRQCQ